MNLKFLLARKKAELTQDQLAKKADVSQADISRIEKLGWTPPSEIRQRLADALVSTADELFDCSEQIAVKGVRDGL